MVLAQLHDPKLLLLLWVIGGVIALCGALSYSELGAKFPRAGGEYAFLSELFSPLAGFLSGWVSFFVGFTAPVAASSLAFSEYLVRTLPDGDALEQIVLIKKAIAVGIILILVVIGFVFGEGSFEHFNVQIKVAEGWAGFKTMGLALMWIMFAYSGWNASTNVGSEVLNPVKNIPRSLITGTLFVTLIYLALNILYVYAVPTGEMKGVISIGGLAANQLFNRTLDQFFSLFIAVILLSAISVLTIIGPRVYYAMAESGHFFGVAKKINRSNVPGISILLQSALAIVFVVSGTFEQIITLLSFSLGIFPILAVWGVFKLRSSGQSLMKTPWYPFPQVLFILFSVVILVLAFLERPVESSIALGIILVGIPAYYLLRRKHGSS